VIQGGREEKLHGNRGFIHNDKRPIPIPKIVVNFRHIYRSTLCPERLRKSNNCQNFTNSTFFKLILLNRDSRHCSKNISSHQELSLPLKTGSNRPEKEMKEQRQFLCYTCLLAPGHKRRAPMGPLDEHFLELQPPY
jgi:hypothetical protein